MRTPALLLALLISQTALAQSELPAAQPYEAAAAVQPIIPGTIASPTTYQSTYTYTSTEDVTDPRAHALKESFKFALQGLLTNTFQPPVPQAEVKRLTEQSDPARFIQSYRIGSESFTPAYTLTTEITWSEKALLNALKLNTPVVVAPARDVMDTDLSSDTTVPTPFNGAVQYIMASPSGDLIARLRRAANTAGMPVTMKSFSRNEAVFEGPAGLPSVFEAAGFALEEDPTAFTPTYRIH